MFCDAALCAREAIGSFRVRRLTWRGCKGVRVREEHQDALPVGTNNVLIESTGRRPPFLARRSPLEK